MGDKSECNPAQRLTMVFGFFCKKGEEDKAPQNLREAFAPLGVVTTKGEDIKLGSVLSKDKPVLLWVMHRFSCPLCRGYAVQVMPFALQPPSRSFSYLFV